MKINQKVIEIIEAYIANDCKLWNIDTNFYNTWKRFHSDLHKKFDINNFYFSKFYVKCLSPQKENNEYIFIINNIKLKPHTIKKGEWSAGGMRQFLQIGEAFGIWNINLKSLNNLKKDQLLEGNFTIDFNDLFDENFMNQFYLYLLKCIQKALFSGAKHICNVGFSLFMCLLFFNQYNEIDNNKLIAIPKQNNKLIKSITYSKSPIFGSLEYLEYMQKIYNETYKDSIQKIQEHFLIDDLIQELYSVMLNKDIDFILTTKEKEDLLLKHKIEECYQKINTYRSKLRTNIISKRVNKAIKHNDLENTYPNEWYVNDCEAAHLYDVWRIKKEISKIISNYKNSQNIFEEIEIKKLINDVENPDNGILLLKQWHDYFDKNLINFNLNGELIFNLDEIDRLEPININYNLQNVKIKKIFITTKMKEYLSRRK